MKKLMIAILLGFVLSLSAEEIRPPLDDVGFCWQKDQINRLMDHLKSIETETFDLPRLVAGISAHDDYLYAGRIYYSLFSRIKTREVVVFGVTHGTVRKAIGDPQEKLIFDGFSYWIGPFKNVGVSKLREYLEVNLDKGIYQVNNEAHKLEHSIEAMIPFLQYFNPDIVITPIMVTGMDFDAMDRLSDVLAGHLAAYIKKNNLEVGKDIFFLISADANHYGKDFQNTVFGEDEQAHERGVAHDREIAESCLSGVMGKEKIKDLTGRLWGATYKDFKDTVWCGKYSIPFGMLTIMKTLDSLEKGKQLKGKILRYSDTYTEGVLPLKKPGFGITAPFSLKHWVGFFSAGFYWEKK
ncbi:MAG: AmmeMemoRadiSam system protein B [Candidatus Aminicenantes bacterium]|nr:AmmeMemoRadiSam system protein B [Candidatus Aminicenantes bacterium]